MLAMEADGWAEWAGAAAELPPEAPPTPIGPFELELGELPELVVTWAARLAGTEDALLWLVEPERQRLLVRYGMGRFAASTGRRLHRGQGLAGCGRLAANRSCGRRCACRCAGPGRSSACLEWPPAGRAASSSRPRSSSW